MREDEDEDQGEEEEGEGLRFGVQGGAQPPRRR
jgi:hypothetical protein